MHLLTPSLAPCIVRSGPAFSKLALQILLPLACPLAPAPLPVGHADESVAQKLQMPSLQQGGTRWRLARKEVMRTIKLDCPRARAAASLASHPQGAVVHEHVDDDDVFYLFFPETIRKKLTFRVGFFGFGD